MVWLVVGGVWLAVNLAMVAWFFIAFKRFGRTVDDELRKAE